VSQKGKKLDVNMSMEQRKMVKTQQIEKAYFVL
jgi:hypothetical protein